MTGYTVHTGSNDKFREGWDKIFKAGKPAGKAGNAAKKNDSKKKSGKVAGQKK